MASPNDNVSMALFCDFENVALGVRDANYEKFDIKPVLERLLLKGSIVVKKAYCDWDRYKGFKGPMHEANFELIEIPHVRLSGKNSADIRMVVDALDLCYTKAHVNTFVIISGDSDFSPLVSKLRENAKRVIGVGVKDSTSDLLVANCDEFIFYDDLVRESRRQRQSSSRGDAREQPPKRSAEEEKRRREDMDKRRNQCVDIAYTTFDALAAERGEGKIWASVLKEAIKRRKPDFSESYYGFRTFGNLLEEMKARGLLEFGRDEKSGAYVYRSSQPVVLPVVEQESVAVAGEGEGVEAAEAAPAAQADGAAPAEREGRDGRRGRGNRGGRSRRGEAAPVAVAADAEVAAVAVVEEVAPVVDVPVEVEVVTDDTPAAPAKRSRAAAKKPAVKKTAARGSKVAQAAADAAEAVQQAEAVLAAAATAAVVEAPVEAAPKRARKPGAHKPSARSKLPKKAKTEAA
ncbi:NYN domain-containing protein [Massilia sp. SR12]